MQFIGEHLRPGQLGHFFVITSFVAALFSAFSYFMAVRTEQKDPLGSRSWLLFGRGGFILHTATIVKCFYCSFLYHRKSSFRIPLCLGTFFAVIAR